jgi:hypothetical protein
MTCSRSRLFVLLCLGGICLLWSTRPGTSAESKESAAKEVESKDAGLTLAWADNFLTIRGPALPGGELRVHYLEAYCRPGSTDRNWKETVIGHKTELVSAAADGKGLELKCMLKDGVVVRHQIRAGKD